MCPCDFFSFLPKSCAIFRAFYHAIFRRQVKERYQVLYESNGVRSLSRTDSAGLFMADHFLDKSVIFLETGCSSWKVKKDGRTSFQLDAICCFLLHLRSTLPAQTMFSGTNLWTLKHYLIYDRVYIYIYIWELLLSSSMRGKIYTIFISPSNSLVPRNFLQLKSNKVHKIHLSRIFA